MSPPRFTPEFKDEAVRQIIERGYSVAEVSARLGVSAHSLYKWVSAVKPDKTDQQANDLIAAKSEILRLKAQLHRTEEERDILKMAARYFARNGQFTRFQPIDWVSLDGALRLCFPSPLFNRYFFHQKLGALDSVRVGADAEILQRIRRFDPGALHILDTPVMLQLDLQDSLTRHEETHIDERGEAPARTAYRQAWSAGHAAQTAMPKLQIPQKQRAFAVPDHLQAHTAGANDLLAHLENRTWT